MDNIQSVFSTIVSLCCDSLVLLSFPESLQYVELLALNGPSVRETGQCLADGLELLLPLLELSVVFKVCGGRQGESIPDPNHKGKQDQRHDPLGP